MKFTKFKKSLKKKTVKKAITSLKKKQLKKEVKAIIRENDESHQAYHKLTSDDTMLNFNSVISSAADMCQIIPNVSKGTASNQRTGDELICQSLKIQGHIRYTPSMNIDDPGRGNIAVRLMVVSNKIRPSFPDVNQSLSPLNNLLKKGGTTTAFNGLLSDLYAPINTDLWTKHYNKVYYLNIPVMMRSTYAGSSGFQDLENIIKFFNIDLKLKKKLIYDDGINGGLTPTNAGPVLLLGYVYLNAATPDTLSTNVSMFYNSVMTFEP